MLEAIVILVCAFLIWRIIDMSTALARLQTELATNTDVTNAVLALVENLSTEIRNNVGDEAALNSLADSLDENSAKLAAAVSANTPAADPATPPADLEPIATDPAAGDASGTSGTEPA